MRERDLSADERALAIATKRAVERAGGLEVCAREVPPSTSQLSRCCSPHHPDSLTLRDAAVIDALGGDLILLRALARLAGAVVVPLPQGPTDPTGLQASVMTLTTELGDVARAIADALRDDDECDATEADAALRELDELDTASAALRLLLQRKKGKAK